MSLLGLSYIKRNLLCSRQCHFGLTKLNLIYTLILDSNLRARIYMDCCVKRKGKKDNRKISSQIFFSRSHPLLYLFCGAPAHRLDVCSQRSHPIALALAHPSRAFVQLPWSSVNSCRTGSSPPTSSRRSCSSPRRRIVPHAQLRLYVARRPLPSSIVP